MADVAFWPLDDDMLRTLHVIEAITAQYNADMAHLDKAWILLGDSGSSTGSDSAIDNIEMSDAISARLDLNDCASAWVIGRNSGLPMMVLSS